jgi:hypothetical protein
MDRCSGRSFKAKKRALTIESGGTAVSEILAWVKVVENADVRQVEQQKDGFTDCTAENI